VTMETIVFRYVTPCSLVDRYRFVKAITTFIFRAENGGSMSCVHPKVGNDIQDTHGHIPEDSNIHS
jgi:hypothetical protein